MYSDETYHIISDGSCDLPQELTEERNITVVPFYVTFDNDHYFKEGTEMSVAEFYDRMVEDPKVFPHSSMPSPQDYYDAFEEFAKAGKPAICICITQKFSGSYQSALNAKELILEDYPDAVLEVIDARINTVLQGLYVLEAARLRDSGVPFGEAVDILLRIRDTGRIFFTVGSFDYLQVNGRIGKVAVVATSKLGIRPIITLKEGEIFASGVSRTRKGSLKKVISVLIKHVTKLGDKFNNYAIDIGYGYDIEEAKAFRAQIIEALAGVGFTVREEDFKLYRIGSGISVHTGPYALGVSIIEKG